jgi:hypothetical protein
MRRQTKRLRRGDEMRRPNSNTKSVGRRRMRRQNGTTPNRWIGGEYAGQTKEGAARDEMRRPNKETAAR